MTAFRARNVILVVFIIVLGSYLVRQAVTRSQTADLPPAEMTKHPSGVLRKFDQHGNVLPFPGNTILCHISQSVYPELYASLHTLYEKLEYSPLSRSYTLLPPSSWHMTVFEGVCDKERKPGLWPDDLAIDASLTECTDLFHEKLNGFDLRADPPYRLKIASHKELKNGISLYLQPQSKEESTRLRDLRDRLSELLHIRAPKHEKYKFHISLAYMLQYLNEDQMEELSKLITDHIQAMDTQIELGAPEFCTFKDMFAFERLSYLESKVQGPTTR